jgi:hypothetical protein
MGRSGAGLDEIHFVFDKPHVMAAWHRETAAALGLQPQTSAPPLARSLSETPEKVSERTPERAFGSNVWSAITKAPSLADRSSLNHRRGARNSSKKDHDYPEGPPLVRSRELSRVREKRRVHLSVDRQCHCGLSGIRQAVTRIGSTGAAVYIREMQRSDQAPCFRSAQRPQTPRHLAPLAGRPLLPGQGRIRCSRPARAPCCPAARCSSTSPRRRRPRGRPRRWPGPSPPPARS